MPLERSVSTHASTWSQYTFEKCRRWRMGTGEHERWGGQLYAAPRATQLMSFVAWIDDPSAVDFPFVRLVVSRSEMTVWQAVLAVTAKQQHAWRVFSGRRHTHDFNNTNWKCMANFLKTNRNKWITKRRKNLRIEYRNYFIQFFCHCQCVWCLETDFVST